MDFDFSPINHRQCSRFAVNQSEPFAIDCLDFYDGKTNNQLLSHIECAEITGPGQSRAPLNIEHAGVIDRASIAAGWERGERQNRPQRTIDSFHPTENEAVSMSFHNIGIPLNAATGRAFHDLLAQHSAQSYNLSAAEIRSISSVLSCLNVGDNQYTNQAHPGDRYAPAFHLDSCSIRQLNGKPVIIAEGNFVNRAGAAGTHFRGVFIDQDGTGQMVQGLALEAPDQQNFQKYAPTFEQMLQSIRWTIR
jgi:hypothetical protein